MEVAHWYSTAIILLIVAAAILGPEYGQAVSYFFAKPANVREIATPPSDLMEAQARWKANPVKHYRLKVQYYRPIYPLSLIHI